MKQIIQYNNQLLSFNGQVLKYDFGIYGGNITYSGDYKIHTFLSSGSLIFLSSVTFDYLLVGGGGVGLKQGGGGGKVLTGTTTWGAATYDLVVGLGGVYNSINGGESNIKYQGSYLLSAVGGSGTTSATGHTAGTNSGGYGGGGGGDSNNGFNASSVGGNGGAGTSSSISGSSVGYGGGGGGNGDSGVGHYGAGLDGGGGYTYIGDNPTPTDRENSGGGSIGFEFGSGYKGIIIIRYKYK